LGMVREFAAEVEGELNCSALMITDD
jgi:hypothetical protein